MGCRQDGVFYKHEDDGISSGRLARDRKATAIADKPLHGCMAESVDAPWEDQDRPWRRVGGDNESIHGKTRRLGMGDGGWRVQWASETQV